MTSQSNHCSEARESERALSAAEAALNLLSSNKRQGELFQDMGSMEPGISFAKSFKNRKLTEVKIDENVLVKIGQSMPRGIGDTGADAFASSAADGSNPNTGNIANIWVTTEGGGNSVALTDFGAAQPELNNDPDNLALFSTGRFDVGKERALEIMAEYPESLEQLFSESGLIEYE